jgi:hypothetical protein
MERSKLRQTQSASRIFFEVGSLIGLFIENAFVGHLFVLSCSTMLLGDLIT